MTTLEDLRPGESHVAAIGTKTHGHCRRQRRHVTAQEKQKASPLPLRVFRSKAKEVMLRHDVVAALERRELSGTWLAFIPAYVGHLCGLDNAIARLVLAYQADIAPRPPKPTVQLEMYVQATGDLGRLLTSKTGAQSDEALLMAEVLAHTQKTLSLGEGQIDAVYRAF